MEKKLILKINFFSVTFNVLNNNLNDKTINFLIKKKKNIAPHISCLNLNFKKFKNIINMYYINNIKKLIVLKGDNRYIKNIYYSYNLINLIKKNYIKFFKIYAAIYTEFHPNSFNYKNDFKNNLIKINNNVNNFITQYFYNFDSYCYFFDDLNKLKKKNINIIPGILPIISINQLIKFSNICKSELPIWLIRRFNNLNYKNKLFNMINLEIMNNIIIKLINFKINNIHFYTLNNLKITNNILEKSLNNINI